MATNMTSKKNSKEIVLVKCQEIPEMISVETRLITKAAATQKKHENLFYITNENDISRQDQGLPTTVTPIQQKLTPVLPVFVQQYQTTNNPKTTCSVMPLAQSSKTLNSSSSNTDITSNSMAPNVTHGATISTQKPLNSFTAALQGSTFGTVNSLEIGSRTLTVSDHMQQTDVTSINMKCIAIQCKLDDDMEDFDVEWHIPFDPSNGNDADKIEKENFLHFVKDNSIQHKHYKECLICGEICKSKKYFYGHMAVHQGPKVLCSKCGQKLDHRKLLLRHKCRTEQHFENAFLQCPHYSCNIQTLSRLELFDHINEHIGHRMYKCSTCGRGFCTAPEFFRHLLIRARCYTSGKRKKYRLYGVESQADRTCRMRVFTLHTFKKFTVLVKTFLSHRTPKQKVCRTCLKLFTNKYIYNRHCVRCIAKLRNRLIQKRRIYSKNMKT